MFSAHTELFTNLSGFPLLSMGNILFGWISNNGYSERWYRDSSIITNDEK